MSKENNHRHVPAGKILGFFELLPKVHVVSGILKFKVSFGAFNFPNEICIHLAVNECAEVLMNF